MSNFKFSFARQYNTERLFDVDTEGLEYFELQDIYSDDDEVFTIEAIYINTKGNFDDRPCLVANCDSMLANGGESFRGYVNLPAHLTATCRDILRDKNAVAAINAGKVGFTIYRYFAKKYNDRECYSIRWVDI